jgi:hypothetical protein
MICGFVAFRFSSLRSALKGLEIVYFTETRTKDGFIKKETNVQIKGQLFLAGLPVGHPLLISEQVSEVVDKEKINRILEDFAKPLASLGLRVITKKLI